MFIPLSILSIYLGYNISLAYFKTQRLIATDFLVDFRHAKASFGSGAIISIIAVYGIKTMIPLLDIVARYVIDKSILISVAQTHVMTSHDIANFLNSIAPYLAYIIPSSAIIIYYSFVLFSMLYLPKVFKVAEVQKFVRRDLLFEVLFLFAIFGLSLWFKSLLISINLQEALLSLNISFIAAFFRSYLETMRES
jgi:hypothetical protein